MKIGKVDTKSDDSRNFMEFLNDFDAILSTQLTKQVNPFWNCLKIPKEF